MPDEIVFRCDSDFTFMATDIDDAFKKLSEHFEDPIHSGLILHGEVHVFPEEEE